MLCELQDEETRIANFMRRTHALRDEFGDVATASLLEAWIDETDRHVWILFESGRTS
jgi:starvation-inducible DNA-binding protein